MKKRNFALFMNLITICLAVCAIAIGVYSIKTASLNIGGSLGFVAHNAKVNIKAYMYGFSNTESGENPVKETNKVQLTVDGGLNIDGNIGEINIQSTKGTGSTKRYFSDASGDLEPITIVLTITNNSDFEVLLEDLTLDTSNYFIICDTPIKVLYTSSTPTKQTTTLTYEIRPAFNDDGTYKELTNASVAISMSFTKTSVNIASTGFTLDETTKAVTGLPTLEQNGGSDVLIIPTVFSDKPGITFTTLSSSGTGVYVPNANLYSKIVILDGYTTLDSSCFCSATNIKYVYIPNSVENIGDDAFLNSGIITLNIPNNVDFYYWLQTCPNLVGIAEGMTELNGVAFLNCSSLQYVKLPKSLTKIYDRAFEGCTSLKRVEFGDTSKTWTVSRGDGTNTEISVANPIQNAKYLTSIFVTEAYYLTKNA